MGRRATKNTAGRKKEEPEAQTIEFLKTSSSFAAEGVFPPTLFANARFSNGILLYPDSVEESEDSVELTYSHEYMLPPTVHEKTCPCRAPVLTPQESELWSMKRSAKSAALHHFPMEAYRLLGTVTREVTSSQNPFDGLSNYDTNIRWYGQRSKPQKISLKAAMTEVSSQGDCPEDQVEAKATELMGAYNEKVALGPQRALWDGQGQLRRDHVKEESFLPLPVLQRWLERQKDYVDPQPHVELYNGRLSVKTDLRSVLQSLVNLSCPKELYKTPLIIPYAVVEEVTPKRRKKGSKKRKRDSPPKTYKIRIGVYASRLLPEVMSCQDLHIVMTALEQDSFRIVEPLHVPPSPDQPVFESCPTPRVIIDSDDDDSDHDRDDDDHNMDFDDFEEEKKSDEDDVVDATMCDSTRDETSITAFSVKGFLKLLESTGNDISNWSSIEPKLKDVLLLNLMLHQQHAICWMQHMENLGGFGINSILWEEREFLDGGLYYYSPALGQIRLDAPPVMMGGILADEQGLGKTLEVVGLVVSSLEKLKEEAVEARKEAEAYEDSLIPTHATLIVVPPALVTQWLAEIKKVVGDALDVQYFDPAKATLEGNPDIVITPYVALHKAKSSHVLSNYVWGRIVLDEMQEIRSSTTKIAKNCDSLVCQRRWMVSGTPLFDGIEDLRGELQFLRLVPYAAGLEDGFFNFSITNHWVQHSLHGLETLRILGMLILRRSKSQSIVETKQPLLGLKPLTVEFVPVPQDVSERAIYCFLESCIARVLKGDAGEKHTVASRTRCLRQLREACVSSVLLNGGMGVKSQLHTLHRWMVQEHRREMQHRIEEGTIRKEGFPFMVHAAPLCCDAAIRYLSQAHEGANVGDEFVSSVTMGMGGGLTNRERVIEDFESQLKEAEDTVSKATDALHKTRSKRAKSLWHLALEKITTGHVPADYLKRVSPSVVTLWKMRFVTISSGLNKPTLLTRGWRPCTEFVEQGLFQQHPDFAWAHPWSYQLAVPLVVTDQEVKDAVLAILDQNSDEGSSDKVAVVKSNSADRFTWKATLQFLNPETKKTFKKKAGSTNGIALVSKETVPEVQVAIAAAKQNLDDAEEAYKVVPSTETQRKRALARKNYDDAQLGLRIVFRHRKESPCHVIVSKARGRSRPVEPHLFTDFCKSAAKAQSRCRATIAQNLAAVHEGTEAIKKLRQKMSNQVSDDVQALSAFDTLVAISEGEKEKTRCPICLCNLGTDGGDDEEEPSLVAMTNCGHLFCAECLKKASANTYRPNCPQCRRQFDDNRPVILIDPNLTTERDDVEERRVQAKKLIHRVSQMLDESNGQLDEMTWKSLYLSIDLPPDADRSRHSRLNAVPGAFLAHLRQATGMPLLAGPAVVPPECRGKNAGLSSKVRALLADLPRDERSVVFSESKGAVLHLQVVLEKAGIGCRALFSAQPIEAAEVALQDWKSTLLDEFGKERIPYPVIIIQAGAAASGLTLTAACKMFLMEPFARQEEEQQAYARCHRYGQEQPVHCKCYFAPVSVESRTLEWRKRAVTDGAMAERETRIVYSSIVDAVEEPEAQQEEAVSCDSHAVLADRTNFLLGLSEDEEKPK